MSLLNETAPRYMYYNKKYQQHQMSEIYFFSKIFLMSAFNMSSPIMNSILYLQISHVSLLNVFVIKIIKLEKPDFLS